MFSTVFARLSRALPFVFLLACLCLSGCSGLRGGNVTVRFQDTPDIAPKALVAQGETIIGEVVSVGGEKVRGARKSSPAARLSIDSPYLDDLRQSSVFIVQEDERGKYLRHEVVDPQSPPKQGELVFMGFNSYQDYLLWRASRIGSRKVDDFLRIIDDALKNLERAPLVEPDQERRF